MRAAMLAVMAATLNASAALADAPIAPIAPIAPAKVPVMATTIVPEQDAAIGLFLAPWKDENLAPPDRPPGLHDVSLAPADAAKDRARTESIETVDSYRRARRQASR